MYRCLIFLILLLALAPNAKAQQTGRTGKDYAVLFYVTTFQKGFASLPETKKETEDIKYALETEYGFICELVPNPTKQQIQNTIRNYNDRLTADDQLLLFFSMHGQYEGGLRDRGYLIAKDGLIEERYHDSWLCYDDLRSDLADSKAKHILVALDACYSGSFGIRSKSPDIPIYDVAEDCAAQFNKTMRYVGRQYCSSGNKDTKTPAKSLFAQKFLEALRDGGDGKVLRFKDLEYWLGQIESPEPETGSFIGHSPGGNFIFVRKKACPKDIPVYDRDGDGVPDAADKCPDLFGIAANAGCPNTVKGEPDADYDGVPDTRDGCPTEYGAAKANGCPDRDNDGVPDKSDKCKDKAGELYWQGCPDSDGDGLPDHEDGCPNQKGVLADNGCPPPDRDNDGVPDKADKCPDQPGEANREGCPDAPKDGLILVQGGTFTMGSPESEADRSSDETQHTVTLSDFFIGKYEVTQKEWTAVMGSNPSWFKNCDDCPVEQVSWDDVQEFLKKLNASLPKGQNPYRLPTEAEWEYAARAVSDPRTGTPKGGGAVLFGNGKNILSPAEVNFDGSAAYKKPYSLAGEYRMKTVPVGSLNSPNPLGLHDMAGNVWEWCSDRYGAYSTETSRNPTGSPSGSVRVLRGGSWYNVPQVCRVANRVFDAPGDRNFNTGFRLARTK